MWWDEALQTGEVFDEAIEAALHAAKAVVVLWSPDSVVSRWVRAEATVADQNNSLLPVTIKACRRPVIFELTQTAELSHWKGNRKDPAWCAFVGEVRRFVSADSQERRSLAAARQAERRAAAGPDAGGRSLRLGYVGALAALVLLVAGAMWWNSSGSPNANVSLRVAAFQAQNGPQAAQFAQELQQDVIDEMGDAGFPITTDQSEGGLWGSKAPMVLNGSVLEAGGKLKVFAQIQDARSGVTLWSQQFEDSAANSDRLGTAIAIAAAEPLYQLREINLQKGLDLAPDDLAKLMKGMQMIDNPRLFDEGMLRRAFQDAVARAPRSAYAHAMLALTLVQDGARSPADQRPALFERARAAAKDAIALSPAASGAGYDALYLMSVYTDPGNISRQEDRLLDGLRNAPEFPYLSMRQCQFLMSVGRIEDAWPYCQRANAMRPLSSPIEWRFAEALKMRGEPALAEQAIDEAVRNYPENRLIRLAMFDILAFGSGHDRAAALLPAMLNQGEGFADKEIEALRLYLLARESGTSADADKAAAAIRLASTDGKLRLDLAIKALASLGRKEEAFALLGEVSQSLPPQMDQAPANAGTSFLFAPETAALRADPRFWTVAKQQGLLGYWTSSGKWPDFCGKEQSLKQCRESADRAGQLLPGQGADAAATPIRSRR